MKTEFKKSFLKDLKALHGKKLKEKIKSTILDVEKAETIWSIGNLKKLKGSEKYYRIRIGDYRIGIIVEGQIKDKVFNKGFSGVYAFNKFIKDAPVFLVVVRKPSKYAAILAGFFRGIKYSLIDIGIACEHFVLQAAEEGLGTCWLGWFNERGVKNVLGIAEELWNFFNNKLK